jgi:hypothetical protein
MGRVRRRLEAWAMAMADAALAAACADEDASGVPYAQTEPCVSAQVPSLHALGDVAGEVGEAYKAYMRAGKPLQEALMQALDFAVLLGPGAHEVRGGEPMDRAFERRFWAFFGGKLISDIAQLNWADMTAMIGELLQDDSWGWPSWRRD